VTFHLQLFCGRKHLSFGPQTLPIVETGLWCPRGKWWKKAADQQNESGQQFMEGLGKWGAAIW